MAQTTTDSDPASGQLPSQPQPPQPQGRGRRALKFQSPEPEPSSPPPPGVTTPPTSPSGPRASSPSETASPSDGPGLDPGTEGTSSRESSARPLSDKALRHAVRQGVLMAGRGAHEVLAREADDRALGLYLTDAEDAENIGDPLASLAARRGGVAGMANPDVSDAIAVLIGLAVYISKQFARWRAAREARAARAGGLKGTVEDLAKDGPGPPQHDDSPLR